MWEELTKSRAHDYALWYARGDFETCVAFLFATHAFAADLLARRRMGDYQRAHEVYTKGCSERSLNYPEYLLEAWLTFETEYGNLADLEFALAKSKRQKKGLERKRARVRGISLVQLRACSHSSARRKLRKQQRRPRRPVPLSSRKTPSHSLQARCRRRMPASRARSARGWTRRSRARRKCGYSRLRRR